MKSGTFAVVPLEVIQDRRLTLMQTRVLIALFSYRSSDTNLIYPRREHLSKKTGYTIQNISKITSELQLLGWIVKNGNGGRSSASRYRITIPETVSEPDTVSEHNTVSGSDTKTVSGSDTKTVSGSDTGKEETNEDTNEYTNRGKSELLPVVQDDQNTELIKPKNKIQVPYQRIVDLYHTMLPGLPVVYKLTPARKGFIRQRFLEDLPTYDHWVNFFRLVSESDFLMGRVEPVGNRSPFRADLEWITRPNNFTKIAEDKYSS